jgi:flagellar biogenesis protein FliO
MNLRIAAIALVVLASARSAASPDVPASGESAPAATVDAADTETAALDAAWSAVESPTTADTSKTIRRRGAAQKSAGTSSNTNDVAKGGSWIRSVGSLAAVVAVILFLAWGAKSLTRGGPLGGRTKRPGVIEVISRTALSPKQALCLVRVGQRMVLVGVTQDSLRTLDVIQDRDAVAALAGEAAGGKSADAERAFRASLEQETVSYTAGPEQKDGRSGMNDLRQRLSAALSRVKGATRQT